MPRKRRGAVSSTVAKRSHPTVSRPRLTRVAWNSIRLWRDLIQVSSIQLVNLSLVGVGVT